MRPVAVERKREPVVKKAERRPESVLRPLERKREPVLQKAERRREPVRTRVERRRERVVRRVERRRGRCTVEGQTEQRRAIAIVAERNRLPVRLVPLLCAEQVTILPVKPVVLPVVESLPVRRVLLRVMV